MVCRGVDTLCSAWEKGAGVLLICDEGLFPHGFEKVSLKAANQPAWSDIPFLLVVRRHNRTHGARATEDAAQRSLLARPVRVPSLVSGVAVALRARMRQYEVRNLMAQSARGESREDDFVAMVSHELRAPLGVIRGLARSLVQRRDEPQALAWAADTISRNVDVLARLVEDLLVYSRCRQRAVHWVTLGHRWTSARSRFMNAQAWPTQSHSHQHGQHHRHLLFQVGGSHSYLDTYQTPWHGAHTKQSPWPLSEEATEHEVLVTQDTQARASAQCLHHLLGAAS